MSFIETLHQARKARLERIAARAVAQAAPEPAPASVARRFGARRAPARRRQREPDDERAWAIEMLGISERDDFPPSRLRIEDIQRATARYFGIDRNDILSAQRSRDVIRPRQVAMYLVRELTAKSYPEIGRSFGRDHTAVLYAVRRVEDLIAHEAEAAADIDRIRSVLGPGPGGPARRPD